VPFGDLAALDQVQQAHGPRIVAILIEPIQGESGVQLAPGYLKAVRDCAIGTPGC
jgi:acetylornithine aminotransferase